MKQPISRLTEKSARALGTQIVKDNKNVRVKFGRTNGEIVLHVFVPGKNNLSRTITNASDWDDHPANERARRNDQMAKDQGTERLMESNTPERKA